MNKWIENLRNWEWEKYKKRKRGRLKNTDFTIIASNCSGTFIYYDLGLQYSSPTINLSIQMDDFVRLVENLRWYMDQELVEIDEESKCPVGLLGDIKVQFVHYKSFDEAVKSWEERKKRINWENLFIIGTDKDGCTYETLKRFEKLPYNKTIFTHIRYPEFPSAYYIKGFEKRSELGVITFFKPQLLIRRYLDDFDYVSVLNRIKYQK